MIKVICLLSGGLDSATTLYIAREQGYDVCALTLRYGQLHVKEIDCAKKIQENLKMKHFLPIILTYQVF